MTGIVLGAVGCAQSVETVKTDDYVEFTQDVKTEETLAESAKVEKESETEQVQQQIQGNKALAEGNIMRASVHDPSIFREVDENGNVMYYVFGTHITTAKSENLVDWTVFTNGYQRQNNTHYGDLSANLSESFAWAGENDSDCKNGGVYVDDDGVAHIQVKKPSSTRKYVCPKCGLSVRATKAVRIACVDCGNTPLEEADSKKAKTSSSS